MKKIIVPFFLIFVLVSCATIDNTRKELDTWIGKSKDTLISEWGVPERSINLDNGESVIQYTFSTVQTYYPDATFGLGYRYHSPGLSTSLYYPSYGPTYRSFWCTFVFTVDNDNKIKKYSFKGNNCKK